MVCFRCKEDKPEAFFSVEKSGYRRKICKSCRTKRITKYRSSGDGLVKDRALKRKFQDAHPGYFEQYLSEKRLAQMTEGRIKAVKRNRALASKAKDVPCADCGLKYPSYVMDFDHVRGEKKGNIATMVGVATALKTLLAEIEKCEVVCSNCHRHRTHARAVK